MSIRIRKQAEEREVNALSPFATRSIDSRGREKEEEPCPVRTVFQRDRDRILHSKAFRRLKHKTQVFIAPEGDHYRTRLTHTLEVSQVARTIARALRLNEDLTEAIALGHDLGHTPFGHAGEEVLNRLVPGGFRHNEQSLRVVEVLEEGRGLNLTREVRDGILKHTGKEIPQTLEGQIVRIADRFAYINHDIDDALRGGILKPEDLPVAEMTYLGDSTSQRLNTMILDMIENSMERDEIRISSPLQQVMDSLRSFMFENVYVASKAKQEEKKTLRVVEQLYEYFRDHPARLPASDYASRSEEPPDRRICDYIAGMTDRFIISLFREVFIPRPWR